MQWEGDALLSLYTLLITLQTLIMDLFQYKKMPQVHVVRTNQFKTTQIQ